MVGSSELSTLSVEIGEIEKQQKQAKECEREKLSSQETRAVTYLRFLVISILFITALVVTFMVYIYARKFELTEFERAFELHANKVIESVYESVEGKLAAMNTMADSITSHALHSNQTFPFVTLPNFPIAGANLRVDANALIIHWLPLVTDYNRPKWEMYSLFNRFHIDVDFEVEKQMRNRQDEQFDLLEEDIINGGKRYRYLEGQQEVDPNILDDGTQFHKEFWRVTDNGIEAKGSGPYLPAWQRSPIDPRTQYLLNLNFATAPILKGVLQEVLNKPEVVMNKVVVPTPQGQALMNANLQIGQFRNEVEQYLQDPLSFFTYPVFDNFGPNRKFAGVLLSNVYWRLDFSNILPPTAVGIICVLENSFNQSFAYRIDGPNATFLGSGDPHDKINSMEISTESVNSYLKRRRDPSTRSFSAVSVNQDFGVYTLRVYPSQDTELFFKTSNPSVYSAIVASTFILTSLVFILFDYYVERRQRFVLGHAVRSGVIVSSLFPEQVHSRLFVEDDETKFTKKIFKNTQNNRHMSAPSSAASAPQQSRPIADFFPETTILFADLSGFTAWSSTKKPEEVFDLLESLYSAFDAIAEKRNVFKVETIGDCYLAVTGLPSPQSDHALMMTIFARDCMLKMTELVNDLSSKLGPDTMSLKLRVGLHSGPVTAGVLRGHKGRFQLFGDAVNTASRMESNGCPGRIHVSEATATELENMGKAHWITPREDKIHAKGKGQLQTFWVTVQRKGS